MPNVHAPMTWQVGPRLFYLLIDSHSDLRSVLRENARDMSMSDTRIVQVSQVIMIFFFFQWLSVLHHVTNKKS